jgi:hypothetical protein
VHTDSIDPTTSHRRNVQQPFPPHAPLRFVRVTMPRSQTRMRVVTTPSPLCQASRLRGVLEASKTHRGGDEEHRAYLRSAMPRVCSRGRDSKLRPADGTIRCRVGRLGAAWLSTFRVDARLVGGFIKSRRRAGRLDRLAQAGSPPRPSGCAGKTGVPRRAEDRPRKQLCCLTSSSTSLRSSR